MTQLRPYQQNAVDAVFDFWSAGGGNPLVEMATGTGKSVVIATLAKRLCEFPDMRLLVLVHVRELVEQNFLAFRRVWPDAPAGIYSAGLGRRDAHHRITFASIQSVYSKARILGARHAVLVDEAHLIPAKGGGMYRELLHDLEDLAPDMRVAGFTATPYRLDSGRLDTGDGALFHETVYSYGIGSGIRDGFLSPLRSKASATEIDVSTVARRGGEFVAGALEAAADTDRITASAAREIVAYGADRRSWLVFCTGIKHAVHVRDALRSLGIGTETITGETASAERTALIRAFKDGRIRCLTNANVLTTGFDAPAVDLVAMLRPTLSTGLYVQIVGRGTRLAEGKSDCLVLDFAGNVRRHGPVDTIEVRPKRGRAGADDEAKVTVETVRAKECPSCENLIALNARTCPHCNHAFPSADKPKHDPRAEAIPILSTEKTKPEQIPVISWDMRRHIKAGSPDSMRVDFYAGLQTFPEWVCLEHDGPARRKAQHWWHKHGGLDPVPVTVTEALARLAEVSCPKTVSVRRNGKWWEIVGRSFADRSTLEVINVDA